MAYTYQRQATFVLALTLLGATTWDYSRGSNSFAVPEYDERVNSTGVEPRVYYFFHETIRVWPISFSAPEDIWVPVVQYKIRGFGHIIPGNQSTYIYDSEESYYQDYRHSMFGVTRKKAGWDCIRHIEIMASGCVPFFVDLKYLPRRTMQFYPKKLLEQARNFPGVTFHGSQDDPSSYKIASDRFDFEKYYELATKILEHSREHLTTRAMAQYVLQRIDMPSPKRALMATNCIDDYLQDTMLHGLKLVLGARLVDFVPESQLLSADQCVTDHSNSTRLLPDYRVNMYMDSWAASSKSNLDTRKSYGRGFTVWNRLSKAIHGDIDRSNVYKDIEDDVFDVVFLTDRVLRSQEQRRFVDHVRLNVDRSKVVALLGDDSPADVVTLHQYHSLSSWIFERELP